MNPSSDEMPPHIKQQTTYFLTPDRWGTANEESKNGFRLYLVQLVRATNSLWDRKIILNSKILRTEDYGIVAISYRWANDVDRVAVAVQCSTNMAEAYCIGRLALPDIRAFFKFSIISSRTEFELPNCCANRAVWSAKCWRCGSEMATKSTKCSDGTPYSL